MSPPASERHYRRQASLAALASTQAAAAWDSGATEVLARSVAVLQYTAAADADTYLNTFDPEPAGTVSPLAFTGVAGDGRSLLTLLGLAETQSLLQIMAATAVQDAGRAAVSAGITARPTLTGYVRMLTAPSCSRCAVLAGRWYKWNRGFARHPRCLVAGTPVSGPTLSAATRRWYEGELVIIHTSGAKKLTITGNHPVLTDRGWLPAHLIDEGCHVASSTLAGGALPVAAPHERQMPALVEDVWSAGRVLGITRVPTSTKDFHGDGGNGEVDVVATNGVLRHRVKAAVAEHVVEHLLAIGVKPAPFAAGRAAPELGGLVSSRFALAEFPSVAGDALRFSSGLVRRPIGLSLAEGSEWDARFRQSKADGSSRDTVARAETLCALATDVFVDDVAHREVDESARWDAPAAPFSVENRATYARCGLDLLELLSSQVSLDRVVKVERVSWSGHVFNASSCEGWYAANGIVVSNCDCRHIPSSEGQAGDLTTDPVQALRSGQVTGLSEANTKAILGDGADMNRIVNQYGVLAAGQPRVLPGSRVLPEQLYRIADGDRDHAVELLQQSGFITT